MSDQFKEISRVLRKLESISYPDAYRIAKEICGFTNFNQEYNDNVISQLKEDKPWEYIKGSAQFAGHEFIVTPNTLIPRIETEQILDLLKPHITPDIKEIVDIGTGSGAISISLAKLYPSIKIKAVDISTKALEVTKKNIKMLGVTNVESVHSDLLEKVKITTPTLIVANLPYIPTNEYLELDNSVKNFEPKRALDGGLDGLDYIKKVVEKIKGNLNVKVALFEIDPSQEEIIKAWDIPFSLKFYKDFRGLVRFFKLYR